MDNPEQPDKSSAGMKSFVRRWIPLFVLTGVFIHAMQLVAFPASSLLGAMFAAIAVAVRVDGMRVPEPLFLFGQGVIGIMIGLRMPRGFLAELQRSWPLFVGGVVWAILASAFLGWLLTKWKVFPGTTAIWGLSPGAASTMTIMSESYGGDIRLVAFMQYLRVVSVVLVTSIVARFWVGVSAAPPAAKEWLIMPDWPRFLLALAVIAASLWAARRFRIPAGSVMAPMIVGILINYSEVVRLDTPPWLLSIGSTLLGWSIGLRFNRPTLRQMAKSFPRVIFAILTLIFVCGVFAAFMAAYAGIDPLTAYLAASPGGIDSVAIIAAASNVDISFVLAMHSARFILVVMTGPFLARQIVKRVYAKEGKTA